MGTYRAISAALFADRVVERGMGPYFAPLLVGDVVELCVRNRATVPLPFVATLLGEMDRDDRSCPSHHILDTEASAASRLLSG